MLERKKVVTPEDTTWETDPARQRAGHLLSPERTDLRQFSVDIFELSVPAGSRSGKHWKMADEVDYVLEGEGYSLHWEVQEEIAEKYYARIAKEPTRHEIKKGDTLYVPQNTVVQHFAARRRAAAAAVRRRTASSSTWATTTSTTSSPPPSTPRHTTPSRRRSEAVRSSRGRRASAWSRDEAASAAGAVVYSLALAVASVALPLLALRAGYSAFGVGALTAVSAVTQMGTRMVLGAVMRRFADWTLVAASGVLLAASCGLVALSAALVPFVVAQLLQGASRACFWTGTQTHVVRGARRSARALSTVNLAASIGLLAGPALAGLLSEQTPVLALAVGAGIALVGVLPTLLLDRLPPFVPPADRPPGRLWRRPGVDVGCWGGVTAGAWRGLLGSYVPVALDAARQSASTIGLLMSVANGAALLGSAAAARVPTRWSSPVVLASMVVTGLMTSLTAAVAGHVVLSAVVLGVSGLAAGTLQVLALALAADAVHPEERGDAIAVSGTFRAAALFVAPLSVAGLVLVVPLAPAVAVVGVAMTVPALALRRRAGTPQPA